MTEMSVYKQRHLAVHTVIPPPYLAQSVDVQDMMAQMAISPLKYQPGSVTEKLDALFDWEACYAHLEDLVGAELAKPLWDWCKLLKARLHERLAGWVAACEAVIQQHTSIVAYKMESFTMGSSRDDATHLQNADTPLMTALADFEMASRSAPVWP